MIKVRIEIEDGKVVEQPIDLPTIEKWIEEGILTADAEIWSDIFTNSEWRKLGELTIYQQIKNKQVGISGVVERATQETEEYKPKTKAYGIPIGALLAFISFFLPWVRVSCNGYSVTRSGSDLAKQDGIFTIILLAAIAIAGIYIYFYSVKKIEKCKSPVVISVIIAFLIMIYKAATGVKTPYGEFKWEYLKGSITPDIGAFGVIIGFVVSLISALSLPQYEENVIIEQQSKFCANCGTKITANDAFCPNCGTKMK